MKLKPLDSGGIMLSYRCQSGCRHCVYACGSKWQDWMSRDFLENLLRGLKETSENLKGFHLAGGEAFLNFDLLLFAVEKCTELGVPLEYVETNAGWCVDYATGVEKLKLLKDAGLRSILISVSPFHAETIPLKRTLTAIRVSEKILGAGNVIVYMWQFIDLIDRFSREKPIPLNNWIKTFGNEAAGSLFWDGYALIPGGRAGVELGFLAPSKYPPEHFARENCLREILLSGHVHFDPYGHYIPLFCGGLSLGKIEDLAAFVKTFDYRKLPLVKILVEEGPYGLFIFAQNEFGLELENKFFAGKCHLCVEVRRFLAQTGVFEELAPKAFYENLRSTLPPLEE
ncbi:Radical SAM domain protein [Thermodesulfatator indicus DSM 15286]|uniref:Radical SAM domain protein n=1 Tax=Thermodesulfatator indicus (strain DSM 15286 / JCM 11887 / CIR29812) TaxID=667014 RepID=F8ADL5_THEID|nr:radical SAM protein [Thermodesulfatator indicus]AEH44893.1 Radical SAM domain protein [Thermodesulfatator indicus DSM 15286]